jgi:hypothetical protein
VSSSPDSSCTNFVSPVHDLDHAAHLGLRIRDVIGVGPVAAAAGGAIAVVGGAPGRHPQPTPPSNTLAERDGQPNRYASAGVDLAI